MCCLLFSQPNTVLIDESILGRYFLPLTLKYIENETVVSGIMIDSTNIDLGDIIKFVNGYDIYALRDSLKK